MSDAEMLLLWNFSQETIILINLVESSLMSELSSSRIYLDKLSRQKHRIASFDNDNRCNLTKNVGFEMLL